MSHLFTPEDTDEEEKQEILPQEATSLKKYHKQYILLTVYNIRVGQSLGDVNLFTGSTGELSQLSD